VEDCQYRNTHLAAVRPSTEKWRRRSRRFLIAFFAVHLVLFEVSALAGLAFTGPPGRRTAGALLTALVFGSALAALAAAPRPSTRLLRPLVIAVALLLTIRFHLPRVFNGTYKQVVFGSSTRPPTETQERLVGFLRELAAAQEQYRMRQRSYAPSVDSLLPWVTPLPGSELSLTRHDKKGWAARVSFNGSTCSVWVRDSTLRGNIREFEGSPTCDADFPRTPNQLVHTVLAPSRPEAGFRVKDLGGRWAQHRADERRTGMARSGAGGAYRWTTRIGGEILGPVAVAGNQVFVGAHGNGEFAALSLDSGTLGFRLRAPNWIHHEPAVAPELVILGFGNNETAPGLGPRGVAAFGGSAPSGAAAYDRRTGIERWRHYTSGTVMTTPVVHDSVVAVIAGNELIAWRLSDGSEVWRALLPGVSPMGNPLLLDTLLIIGVEPATLCALDVRTGEHLFCRVLSTSARTAGHSSAAAADGFVLKILTEGVSLSRAVRTGWWMKALLRLVGVASLEDLLEQEIVASESASGRERWRVHLGIGNLQQPGHTAGTPTVADGVAYVPSPINGRIIAVRTDSGRVLWSTDVNTARGSVLVTRGAVLAATRDTNFVVLDAATGRVRCRQRLLGLSDRAGPTVAGETGILALRNGMVLARPLSDWLNCRA